MNRIDKVLQKLISDTSEFIAENPRLRQQDRDKLDEFLYKVEGILTVEAVKLELIEEQLLNKVITQVESRHLEELEKVRQLYESLNAKISE